MLYFLYVPRKPGEAARLLAAGAGIMKLCVDVGGSISGEHGIGIEKQNAFNPTGWCNPGKILPPAESCAPGELACRPHPLEERGLAQRL